MLVIAGDHESGTGALALMTSSSVRGIVSLGCKSATLSIHAALQSASATTRRARLELTLKCSDVTILAAAHESVSWRLQEWQRMLPGVVCIITLTNSVHCWKCYYVNAIFAL